jgi:Mrp family chromosome partitioning ATPase
MLMIANLALSLQQTSGDSLGRTARVGLLDLDIFGPSVPKLMGLEGHEPDMSLGESNFFGWYSSRPSREPHNTSAEPRCQDHVDWVSAT